MEQSLRKPSLSRTSSKNALALYLTLFFSVLLSQDNRVNAFVPISIISKRTAVQKSYVVSTLYDKDGDDEFLDQKTFGGYTVKQRLREEIESPFRTVRLAFFASSTGSAFIALYFSSINALKASQGIGTSGPSLDDSINSCAINVAALVICAGLTYWDYQNGEKNLARIAKGGRLARLQVKPAIEVENGTDTKATTLKEYRRASRVLIAAGGPEYISILARSLNSDQLSDKNSLPSQLMDSDIIVVPVLLDKSYKIADTRSFWNTKVEPVENEDRNFDIHRSDSVLAFPPAFSGAWAEYLESDIDTAVNTQGFDVFEKGITITVKKNGRILKRTTGQPPWNYYVGLMGDTDAIAPIEVLDGSEFGMPGDSEKYESQ
uniref:Uncharacterized protein n=1 Tax=Eucampia antarctica TaxID=49252 RepID=A0A7S2SH15_9STRA|mmetsp:Transcript_8197/g.7733  ORF Transcript_8197/g.7733 Transcript_8197/m.7733 type:complete len:376 (+) Transcript_8197:101-1228(+)|eukprot:CAMPEP_0197831624 /NCGR_PEP_ID=MMETSP1437-20131217/11378_1 /TAXON_ID=49252 ORGANISM="Eucampia antarctica, Strain CCMP1452" /NCGR_SAMPLE_ID=MMETSP1437 /ASSEMBLY_ACC=CAM_ASM_001096 /LENGTH=375 /DNA_ID=CAMNT_0043434635 /DNA_START=100 /DNA_END=1227 /DNA_ORIENTATION=+